MSSVPSSLRKSTTTSRQIGSSPEYTGSAEYHSQPSGCESSQSRARDYE